VKEKEFVKIVVEGKGGPKIADNPKYAGST